MKLKSKIQNPKSKINPNVKSQITKQKFCHLSFVLCYYFVICALLFVIGIKNSYSETISSTELIEQAKDYDGKIVSFQGEAIGDIMKRGGFAWINVNDGEAALGIWLNSALTKEIVYTGSYKSIGDTVLVSGEFRRACPQHGGDLDIHADSLTIIKQGNFMEEEISPQKLKAALSLLGVVLCFGILRFLKRKPKKK